MTVNCAVALLKTSVLCGWITIEGGDVTTGAKTAADNESSFPGKFVMENVSEPPAIADM